MKDDYEIRLESCPSRAQVWAGERLLADSERATILTETDHVDRLYFPSDDVYWGCLEANEHHTTCPLKGTAKYWDVRGEEGLANVAWSYPNPIDGMEGITELVCFYQEKVQVVYVEQWPDGTSVKATFPVWGDAAELVRLIDVEPRGDNQFISPAHGIEPRSVVEGGQLLAEAVVAASKALPNQRVTSASMIFSRGALFDHPHEVVLDLVRVGRNFSSVAVRTAQHGKICASGVLLMDAGGSEVIRGVQEMPDVPGPDEAVPYPDFGVPGRDLRVVGGLYDLDPETVGPPALDVWVRFNLPLTEPYLHSALMAQSTTHWAIAASMLPHAGVGESQAHVILSTGIMAVTVAFHDDVDVREWLLYRTESIWAGRGLCQGDGRIFTQDGRLAASYSVQAMVRPFATEPAAMGQDFRTVM